jgi:hypothetical protein
MKTPSTGEHFASHLARPEIEKHLCTMIASVKTLPQEEMPQQMAGFSSSRNQK